MSEFIPTPEHYYPWNAPQPEALPRRASGAQTHPPAAALPRLPTRQRTPRAPLSWSAETMDRTASDAVREVQTRIERVIRA
jgi:hypothetical protein